MKRERILVEAMEWANDRFDHPAGRPGVLVRFARRSRNAGRLLFNHPRLHWLSSPVVVLDHRRLCSIAHAWVSWVDMRPLSSDGAGWPSAAPGMCFAPETHARRTATLSDSPRLP